MLKTAFKIVLIVFWLCWLALLFLTAENFSVWDYLGGAVFSGLIMVAIYYFNVVVVAAIAGLFRGADEKPAKTE